MNILMKLINWLYFDENDELYVFDDSGILKNNLI